MCESSLKIHSRSLTGLDVWFWKVGWSMGRIPSVAGFFPLTCGLAGRSAPPPREASTGLAPTVTSCGPDLHVPALSPEGTLSGPGCLSLSAGWPVHHPHQRGRPWAPPCSRSPGEGRRVESPIWSTTFQLIRTRTKSSRALAGAQHPEPGGPCGLNKVNTTWPFGPDAAWKRTQSPAFFVPQSILEGANESST